VGTLSSANFTDSNILVTERNHIMKITGVPVHKLGNKLMAAYRRVYE